MKDEEKMRFAGFETLGFGRLGAHSFIPHPSAFILFFK
ncbi:hypothetical protein CfE428DRAFT_2045 [Chthoniobacter flavus Ellin428]|uniref:Uncharacterized protein n=1 Tax=Chthoniobacter flavus Ellin428 TaxID=497964 RepID=B4CZF7_9BACT|nr:hypothetical protein CfE428DRAFT_2045 [Chthoniobacter flavus Ellin428]